MRQMKAFVQIVRGRDDGDAGDAQGPIDADEVPAGGRKVAGSNPVAPTN